MKVYHYDKETGEFTGTTEAAPDPLELKLNRAKRWLLPAYATFEIPPIDEEGKVIVWAGDKWMQIDIPKPSVESMPTEKELKERELEAKIRVEMDRLLREQAIASLKTKGEL